MKRFFKRKSKKSNPDQAERDKGPLPAASTPSSDPDHLSSDPVTSACDEDNGSRQSAVNELSLLTELTVLPRALSDLNEAITQLKESYTKFTKYNNRYLLIEDDFRDAFENADAHEDFANAAQTFRDGIKSAMVTIRKKQKGEEGWTTKVGVFITKLYPVAKIALGVSSSIGEVSFHLLCFLSLRELQHH